MTISGKRLEEKSTSMNFSWGQLLVALLLLVVGLLAGYYITSAFSSSTPSEAEIAAEVAEIRGMSVKYAAALNAGDFENWIVLWDPEGVRMPPDQPQSVGLEEIRATVEPGFEAFDFSNFAVSIDEILVFGNKAYMRGPYHFSMTPKEGGETLNFEGKYLSVLRKQADGSWKFYIDCFNYDGPPA